jgi:hypothetical protein
MIVSMAGCCMNESMHSRIPLTRRYEAEFDRDDGTSTSSAALMSQQFVRECLCARPRMSRPRHHFFRSATFQSHTPWRTLQLTSVSSVSSKYGFNCCFARVPVLTCRPVFSCVFVCVRAHNSQPSTQNVQLKPASLKYALSNLSNMPFL